MSHMSYVILWLPLLHEILHNMCIITITFYYSIILLLLIFIYIHFGNSHLPVYLNISTVAPLINDTHMEKLCFTQFSSRMVAWLLLTFLHKFTQLIKFYTFHHDILKSTHV